MSLIKDKNEFEKFINILPDLQNDEVYFISLSARNKYLTDEERKYYGLGRTEMFARNIVRDKNDFEYVLNKLESALQYKKTKTGLRIPEKCLIVYININPSSMLKTFNNFTNEMNREWIQILFALQNKKQPNYSGILYADRHFMNNIQKSRSRKIFIDIDFDVKNFYIVNSFITELAIRQIKYFITTTRSGYHVLIDLETLKDKKFNLNQIIQELNILAKKENGEVIINSNQMISIPGTLHARELVRIL